MIDNMSMNTRHRSFRLLSNCHTRWLSPISWLTIVCLFEASIIETCAQKNVGGGNSRDNLLKRIPAGPGVLDIGGSLRLRSELYDNFNIKGYGTDESDNVLLERFRLNLDYYLQNNLHAFIQVQDAHFWFSDLQLQDFGPVCPYQNPLDLREGYIEWNQILNSPFGFKIGRQTITYRDGRIWGPGDWGNTGRYTWDAMKFLYDTESLGVDLIAAKQVISDKNHFDDSHHDYDAYGMYSRIKNLPIALDLFYILKNDNRGSTDSDMRLGDHRSHAAGVYTAGTLWRHLDWSFLGAYQFGERAEETINALGINAQLGYTFDISWKPRLGVEYSYASGDHDLEDGRYQTFDGLFGGIDRFYGRMNMFAWMNLEDYQLSFSVNPMETLNVSLDYHYFKLASDRDAWYFGNSRPMRFDSTGNSGSSLGQEIDLLAKWMMNKYLELYCGYAYFFPGSFIFNTGNHQEADWLFIQITMTI